MTEETTALALPVERIATLERENGDLRNSLNAEKQRTNKLRQELSESRTMCGRLERQLAGYDEDRLDPQKQKGIGAIPVDLGYGPDMSQVEAIEQRLGMAPTTDVKMRQLGSSIAEDPQRLLGARQAGVVIEAEPEEAEYLDAVVEADHAKQVTQALQLLWRGRALLLLVRDGGELPPSAAADYVTAVHGLPRTLFGKYLDLEAWDGEGLPPARS